MSGGDWEPRAICGMLGRFIDPGRALGMALKDRIAFGMSLPHRSPDTIDMQAVHAVAQRAEALGFSDLWVTENTLDHVTCFDPVVVLTYAAAVTTRIRV